MFKPVLGIVVFSVRAEEKIQTFQVARDRVCCELKKMPCPFQVPAKEETAMDLDWTVKPFQELTATGLYQLLKLRTEVFVVEQACAYLELDGKDLFPGTLHLTGFDPQGVLGAYLRILAPGDSYSGVSLGRVVVAKAFRGHGIARVLVEKGLEAAREGWPGKTVEIGAQSHLKSFYESQGFVVMSDTYLEDGIPHIDMALEQT